MKLKVIANKNFEGIRDIERDVYPKAGDIWETEKERAEFLQSKGVVEILPTPIEIKEEEAVGKIDYNIEENTPLKVEFKSKPKKKTTKK